MKRIIRYLITRLPYINDIYRQSLNSLHPNGHFYSPVISIEEIKKRADEIWKHTGTEYISGIELNSGEQQSLLAQFIDYYDEMPFKPQKQENIRYQFENEYYSYTDGIILYSMIRHFKPGNIIEIGSGFSSALMLDTNELFFDHKIHLTFIDPNPQRLYSLMTDADRRSSLVMEKPVQHVSAAVFEKLQAGDILFVDSAHVTKTGSDLNYILFEVLPVLKSGVLIHFHDIYFPFEYPKEVVFRGSNWNEAYILKAFLMYNEKFKIRLFPDYLHKFHKRLFGEMPLCYRNPGGNLWVEKI